MSNAGAQLLKFIDGEIRAVLNAETGLFGGVHVEKASLVNDLRVIREMAANLERYANELRTWGEDANKRIEELQRVGNDLAAELERSEARGKAAA